MKELILVALNDDNKFWFESAVSFFVSLSETDYKGDIGVISYGISNKKREILEKNNILVFEASNKYTELVLDRHYSTYEIGKNYNYEKIALYDGDIWFPNKKLTIFNVLKNKGKLYCSPDYTVANFIFESAKDEEKNNLKQLVAEMVEKKGFVWQVGVIAGHLNAWKNYTDYLDKLIKSKKYNLIFGIDTAAIIIYSEKTGNIEKLHNKYNCLANDNLINTNISLDRKLLEEDIYIVDNQIVEGIHVTRSLRNIGDHYYEYLEKCSMESYKKVLKYKFVDIDFVPINVKDIIKIYEKIEDEEYVKLELLEMLVEQGINIKIDEDKTFIEAQGMSIVLKNPFDEEVKLTLAVTEKMGYKRPRALHYSDNKKHGSMVIRETNVWIDIKIKPKGQIRLSSYDLDVENSKIIWVFDKLKMI